MGSEANLWNRLRGHLADHGDFHRVENYAGDGTPDVNFCIKGVEGWIELKQKDEAPARPTTAVFKKGGLRPEQIRWFRRRRRHGGRAFVLAQVARELFLLWGDMAPTFNDAPIAVLRDEAWWHVDGALTDQDVRELVAALVGY